MRQSNSETSHRPSRADRRTSSAHTAMILVEPQQTTEDNTDRSQTNPHSIADDQRNYVVIDSAQSRNKQRLSADSKRPSALEPMTAKQRVQLENQEATKRHKKMRNNKLTSMLVILFGLVLLAAAGDVGSQVSNSSSISNRTSELLVPIHLDTADEELGEDSDRDLVAPDDTARLSSLLVDTTSEAVEKLIVEPSRAAPSSDNVNTNSDESADDETTTDITTGAGDDNDAGVTSLPLTSGAASKSNSSSARDQQALKEALEVYKRWRSTGDDIIELFSRKVLPVIMENGYDLDGVSMANLLQIFNAIRAHKAWPLKLLDASAKLTPGILMGTQSDFGDFDECLNVRADNPSDLNEADVGGAQIDPLTGLKSTTIVGKYCIADVEFPKPPRVRLHQRNEQLQTDFAPIELRRPLLNFNETADFKDTIFVETANFFHMLYVDPIRVGVCLTNKIDPSGFANIINKLAKGLSVSIDFKSRCVTKYDRPIWSTQQVVSAYVLLGACTLVLLSTLLDLLHAKLNKLPLPQGCDAWKEHFHSSMLRYQPLFTSFSIIRNTKRLFKQQKPATVQQCSVDCQNHHQYVISSTLDPCLRSSFAAPSSHESSSLESTPSIERRSSLASSAINLIGGEQQVTKHHQLASFVHVPVASKTVPSEDRPKLGKQANNLNCLHGIRVITMTWMIVNHTYLFGGFFVLWAHRRLIDIAEWPKSVSFQLVLNGWLTVETYFFLSAAIIVLNVMPLMRSKRFAYSKYILHRLIRLLPAYVGLVCLNFLWPLVSSGPVWLVKGRSFIQTPCENYLWTNFLFINNWIWPEKQCMVHTWFLSADFQLYLIAPLIVYLLYRRPVFGHSLNIIVAVLASILSGFVIYANKLMPTTLINRLEFDSIKQQLSYSYFATYQHMGPYCLGIFIGYLLHKRPQVQLPKHLTWCLWLLLPPLSFTTLLLTYLWNGAYDEPELINPSPIVSALYVAIHRTIWTSLLAWIVFACATGRAKIMSSFLSNPIFVPLSRLSFSIYLVHLPVIMFRALNLRHTIEWTDANILWEACGNFVVSLIFGYFLNVFFESPIINLERVVFGRSAAVSSGDPRGRQKKIEENVQIISRSQRDSDASAESYNNESDQSSSSEDRKLPPNSKFTSQQSSSTYNGDRFGTTFSESPEQPVHQTRAHGQQQRQVVGDGRTIASSIGPNLEQQLESLATTKTSLETDSCDSQQVAPPDVGGKQQTPVSSSQRLDLYLPHRAQEEDEEEDQLGLKEDMFSGDNDTYPVPMKSLTRIHNPDRPQSNLSRQLRHSYPTRPTQYATLARTSRPNQEDWPLGSFSQSLFGDDGDHYDNYHYVSRNGNGQKARSHLGEPIGQRLESMTGNLGQQRFAYSSQRHRPRPGQRLARYSTLTSTGNWQGSIRNQLRASPGGDWLQPGALLPRIDSSTLRRQQKMAPREAAASIAEESNSLDYQTRPHQ